MTGTREYGDCTKDKYCPKQMKIDQAMKQLMNIEEQLKKAIQVTDGKKPIVVSGNLIETLLHYLKHVDTIDALTNGYTR